MSAISADVVPFDDGVSIRREGVGSRIEYRTNRRAAKKLATSQLMIGVAILLGWIPAIAVAVFLYNWTGYNKEVAGFSIFFTWPAVVVWAVRRSLRLRDLGDGEYSPSDRIILEDEFLVVGKGKRYARSGIRRVWIDEPDTTYTYSSAQGRQAGQAIADLKSDKLNGVAVQYGDKTVKIVDQWLSYPVAEGIVDQITEWVRR